MHVDIKIWLSHQMLRAFISDNIRGKDKLEGKTIILSRVVED